MARYSAGCLTNAGSTTLPIISLYGAAAATGKLREIGLFNTTDTAVALKLVRITTAGTKGAALTNAKQDPDTPAASCAAFNTHSSTGPTTGDDLGYRCVLGAAKGSGVVWTFPGDGIHVALSATGAIGVIVENGTGQAVQAYIVWDE